MENIDVLFKEVKKDFFALRNGVIADAIRKLYEPGATIYGLTVEQFLQLAKKYPKDLEFGLKLWNDQNTRESRLFALYVIPAASLDKATAKRMIHEVGSIEEAEFLAFKILRHLPFAKELFIEVSQEQIDSNYTSYCISMFKKNLDQN